MDHDFDRQKATYLKKLSSDAKDRSKKGDVDVQILPLLDAINGHPDYYTTSSCAGRIDLFVEPASGKKHEGEWLFVSHDAVVFKDLEKIITGRLPTNTTWFRMEGAILHVCCRDMDVAETFLRLCKETGWKHSGIMSSGSSTTGRIIIESTTSERMDVPVAKDDELFVPEKFVGFLVKEANEKLLRTREKMNRLEKAVKSIS